jgi:hypothetical protein
LPFVHRFFLLVLYGTFPEEEPILFYSGSVQPIRFLHQREGLAKSKFSRGRCLTHCHKKMRNSYPHSKKGVGILGLRIETIPSWRRSAARLKKQLISSEQPS